MATTGANWKNVNNWHWIEKDVTEWAHAQLQEALLVSGVSSVASVEGDVSIAVRKGRIRHIFDLTISLKLEGDATARIVDYMSDTERPAFEVMFVPHGCLDAAAQDALRSRLWDALAAFRADLDATHAASLIISAQGGEASGSAASSVRLDPVAVTAPLSTGSLSDSVAINAPPHIVFDAFTRPAAIGAWSRGTAAGMRPGAERIAPGDAFSLLNGGIQCAVTSMATASGAPMGLAMEWRLRDWSRASTVIVPVNVAFEGNAKQKNSSSACPVPSL